VRRLWNIIVRVGGFQMRIISGAAVTAFLVATAAAQPADEGLWRGARAGMTPAEVQSVVPEAVRPPAMSASQGHTARLWIQATQVAASPAQVHFYFKDDGGLSSVRMTVRGDHLPSLKAKYGEGTCHKDDRGMEECTFTAPGKSVKAVGRGYETRIEHHVLVTDGL
jgi:hypothetical protein